VSVGRGQTAEPSNVDNVETPPDIPHQPSLVEDAPVPRMSRLAITIVILVVIGAVAWVLLSWRVLRSPLVDAVGEAAGSVFLALLIVSVVGALRRSRRR
jgi:hypothetical protein